MQDKDNKILQNELQQKINCENIEYYMCGRMCMFFFVCVCVCMCVRICVYVTCM